MPPDAATFFGDFFRELGRRDIPFVILHGYEQLPEQMSSDIDFAVRNEDLRGLLPLQRELAQRQGWVLTTFAQGKLYSHYAVFFDATEPSRCIQFDACGHYIERGCFILRDDQLLEGRRPYRAVGVPAPANEFAYLLARALLKRKPIEVQLPRLRQLWAADPHGAERRFQELIGNTAGTFNDWLARPAAEWEARLRPLLRARHRFRWGDRLRELLRVARRFLRPAGMHLVILGPDGVGKSTLIARLGLPGFQRVTQFHFRPGVLGKKNRGTVEQPHAQPPRPVLLSLAKVIYYFADHWLGFFLRTYSAKARNELVVFDRSFEDVFVDPGRYRLSGCNRLSRWLNRLLPRADLTVVLDADPEVIHARKPELPVEELRRQRVILKELAGRRDGWVLVSTSEPPEQVARTVQCHMISFLAKRQARRHPV